MIRPVEGIHCYSFRAFASRCPRRQPNSTQKIQDFEAEVTVNSSVGPARTVSDVSSRFKGKFGIQLSGSTP